jgi:hypothetical protein
VGHGERNRTGAEAVYKLIGLFDTHCDFFLGETRTELDVCVLLERTWERVGWLLLMSRV